MAHLSYLGVLVFIALGTGWLELVMRTRVYRRWRRLVLSVIPVTIVFIAWDLYAINAGHWFFDPRTTTGVFLPGNLPLDEALFFLVVPAASILTLEAVRVVKGWPVGDESGHDVGADHGADHDDPVTRS